MSNFKIVPAFPSVISSIKISEDIAELWKTAEHLDFHEPDIDNPLIYSSVNMEILNDFNDIKKTIINYFYTFKNDILKLHSTDFDITTSWIIKTEPGGFCQYHSHKNSFYSGVLFKETIDEDNGGKIMFNDFGIRQETLMINDPSEKNIFNEKTISIRSEKNLLVFFPSFLMHRITEYTGKITRYSMSFNFFPKGKIGYFGSTLTLNNI